MKKIVYIFILVAFANAFALQWEITAYNNSDYPITITSHRLGLNKFVNANDLDQTTFEDKHSFKNKNTIHLSNITVYVYSKKAKSEKDLGDAEIIGLITLDNLKLSDNEDEANFSITVNKNLECTLINENTEKEIKKLKIVLGK